MGTPTGGDVTTAAPASQTVTITDDDPTPTLSIGDVTVTEGDTTDVTMTFTVSLSAASGQAVAVNYATADGTAISPADYTAVPSTVLNFTAGQTSRTFNVTVKSDSLDEPAETLTASLSSPVNATISRGTAIGTINDAADDVPPPSGGGGGAWGLPNLVLLLGWWIRRRRSALTA